MSALPSVAIVILNWNGKKFLQQFLPSVLTTTYSNLRIIVADNASSDNSISFISENFPGVTIIELPQNLGFAKGYNEALKKVNTDYYVLLNSDVEITENWLQPMIEVLQQNEYNMVCQPKVLSFYDKNMFEYAGAAGGWIDSLGYPFSRGRVFDVCEKDEGQYNTTEEIFWASGAAFVIKQKGFWEAGGFDESFFAHQEEIDLCWRLKLKGYKIYCCHASVVYHVGGGTLHKGNNFKTYLNFRNNMMMLSKNLNGAEAVWKIPLRLLLDQVTAWKGLVGGEGGYFKAIQKAQYNFLSWSLSGKKTEKALKRAPISSLTGVYKGSIVWQHFIKKKNSFLEILKK
ncbi:MAG: glycosyltransferase family 2 protein [Flavisolibacter sp.]|nr:glycosyltransferase family 2 protein [Flavisolibacter sp.]